jgi:hypothetical protein
VANELIVTEIIIITIEILQVQAIEIGKDVYFPPRTEFIPFSSNKIPRDMAPKAGLR